LAVSSTYPGVLPGIQLQSSLHVNRRLTTLNTKLQSSLHVNRKPIHPNVQAAEQRNVLTVQKAIGDGDPLLGVVFKLRPCGGECVNGNPARES